MSTVLEEPDLTDLDPFLDENDSDDEEDKAHIIKGPNAEARVTEAMVYGYELQALCGYRWIPRRNPDECPICKKCLNIYQQMKSGEVDEL